MASMGAVLDSLRDEIRKRIYAITPEVKVSDKWSYHRPTSATQFEAEAGKPRLFKIGWWRPRLYTIGYETRKHEVTGEIKIHYGPTDEDHTAAAADADDIARALDSTSWGSTAGVDYCIVAPGDLPGPEITGEGDGLLSTIPLYAVIETTA